MSDKDRLFNIPLSSDTDSVDDARTTNPNIDTTTNSDYPSTHSLEPDLNPEEEEEKQRLITQVLELQNTLDDLSSRVDSVKEENLKLKSENLVLGQYIENLMAASTVFHSATPKSKKK